MRKTELALLGATCVVGGLAAAAGDGAPAISSETAQLKYRQDKDWEIVLPNETWTPVGSSIAFEGQDVEFVARRAGELKLEIDTNGDGAVDADVRGLRGVVDLRGKLANGERYVWSFRMRSVEGSWSFAPSGSMVGKLHGVPIEIIDQNNNGVWNELGVDAMTVAASKGASFLSRIVNLDGDLFEIEVAADGSEVTATPWSGASGVLDLRSEFESRGDLLSAVVTLGDTSFNVANRNGLRVPVGQYEFAYGFLAKGLETAEMAGGRMVPLIVRENETHVVEWGGPLVAEFDYSLNGETVTVASDLQFFGSAGEEYTRFQPDAKSPKILVLDKESGELLDSGRFAGC